ncbi:FAD-dependent thymidylate synthase [Anaeromyxobacter paludicola]|uniref:Flavin-dependent thymidylate synthase n=1 Tax=Anaeromyxobacter paludicola TaxID=2918171 RepID=A0ABM7X556_9BACT|nr:FAD-dependent thymidylate synthase [Anaeromyxobacter paludicola]BDG06945.1 thymidylate synthase (FAD) [Anaeromyxobacter paludicola]
MALEVTLIDYARDPLTKLYGAYRTCYTPKTPNEVWAEIGAGKITPEQIRGFIQERLKTGHASPLEQVVFWFGISGVSRSLSHQFVRHRIGISFEQQSQRYVKYKEERLDYVTPKSFEKTPGMAEEYEKLMAEVTRVYQLALAKGVPAEDARFVLPNATPTNFQVMVNFAELLHIADLRLCWRAQWEIRHMVALMRRAVVKAVPEIGVYLQPKCGDKRTGYCDEPYQDWERCPMGKQRPHKEQIFALFREYKAGNLVPLTEDDLRRVEDDGQE